jgi:predicted transporter
MLYQLFWLFYALGIVTLISIGILGIFFFLSMPAPRTKVIAVILSVIIILAGLYFSYQWNVEKKEIQLFTQQVEETINQYLAAHKK